MVGCGECSALVWRQISIDLWGWSVRSRPLEVREGNIRNPVENLRGIDLNQRVTLSLVSFTFVIHCSGAWSVTRVKYQPARY